MRKLFIASIFFVLFINYSVKAQTGIRFGLKAGYSLGTQYGIKTADLNYDVSSNPRHGFTGGFFLYFPISEAFGVQQEFLYTMKGSRQDVAMTQPPVSTTSEYNLNYFELPIMFRYTFVNIKNVGIYGSSGFGLSMLLNGEYNVAGEVDTGPGGLVQFGESGDTDGLDEFDYSFIYGLGLNFDILNKNCFFDYRQTIGWNTLLMPTSEGGEPAPLRNQTYSFTLGMIL